MTLCAADQAATSAVPPGVGREPPRDGDGYTYEHLASRNEAWLDFMADTVRPVALLWPPDLLIQSPPPPPPPRYSAPA